MRLDVKSTYPKPKKTPSGDSIPDPSLPQVVIPASIVPNSYVSSSESYESPLYRSLDMDVGASAH